MTLIAPTNLAASEHRATHATGLAEWYLVFLGLVLTGYALDGRGFAYLGYPPLFIGELTMLAGIAVLLRARGWTRLFETPPMMALVPFVLLGLARTAFDFPEYRMDALRDAAIYYYSAFAVIVGGLVVAEPRRLAWVLTLYKRFIPIFLICIPLVAFVYRFFWDSIPRWPGGDILILQEKEGDVMVHLAGIVAFWSSGLAGAVPLLWTLLLAGNAAVLGVVDRAGLLSFGASVGLGMIHNPRAKLGWSLIGAVIAAVLVLWITGIRIDIPGGKGRELSFEQIKLNITSIAGDSGLEGMDSTKEWRMNWWRDIVADTLFGRHFWAGLGFGVNLADEYGYQVQADHSLRSPHDAHMTILARMGVPGLALWIVLQMAWGISIARAYLRSRLAKDRRWQGTFFFLGVFWLAFLINASFDVYLEGPMGGIWFWTTFGLGAAALWIYEHRPEAMYGIGVGGG